MWCCLVNSNNVFVCGLVELLSVDKFDDDVWDDFEIIFIIFDLGVGLMMEFVEKLCLELVIDGIFDLVYVCEVLYYEFVEFVGLDMDCFINLDCLEGKLVVVFMVGVNGMGKMMICGKLVCVFVVEGKMVFFGVVDIFCVVVGE